MILRCISD